MRRTWIPFVLAAVAVLTVQTTVVGEDAEKAQGDWYDAAVAERAIKDKAYTARLDEIMADLNAARHDIAGLEPLEYDRAGSEGHFLHARWLLRNMRDPLNSGGVTNFNDEQPGTEFFSVTGRSIARDAVIAFKYIRRDKTFRPSELWLGTVLHRLPWMMRTAKQARIGFAEGVVPDGAEFAGWRWGVIVMTLDRWFWSTLSKHDAKDMEPVICPRDGAENVPIELVREAPDIVPDELSSTRKGELRKLGFPITFSYFGGQSIFSETEVELVRLDEVPEEDEPRRKPPSRGKRKPKKKTKKPAKTKTVEVPLDVYVSTPNEKPLRGDRVSNHNTVVVLPEEAFEPEARYRVTLRARVADADGNPQEVELVTTFKTAPKKKK